MKTKTKEKFLIKTIAILILVVCFGFSFISNVLAARDFTVQSTAGVPFFFIEGDDGKVGISTISPGYKLDVLTPYLPLEDDSSFIRIQRDNADFQQVGLTIYDTISTSLWSMYVPEDSSDLYWENSGGVKMVFSDDGYFGIGPDYLTPTGLLDVNNKFIVTDTQVTMNVPLNLAAAGDISIASDLQFTSPTASYIKSYAPLYIEAGDPSQNVDLTLRGSNLGKVIVDDNFKVTGEVDVSNNKIVNLGTPTEETDAATMGYVDGALTSGDADWAGVGEDPISLTGEIYHTGNIGIGTTDPFKSLTIETATPEMSVGESSTIYGVTKWDVSLNKLQLQTYGNSYPISIGNDYLYVDASSNDGNVGIGSTSPATDLDVAGNIQAAYYYDRDNSDYYLNPAAGGTGLGLRSSGSIYASGVDDNYFAGDVGIGTTAPGNPLAVIQKSDAVAGIMVNSTSDTSLRIDKGSVSKAAYISFANAGSEQWIAGTTDSGNMPSGIDFMIGASKSDAKLYIQSNGNVGIGVTDPKSLLQVGINDEAYGDVDGYITLATQYSTTRRKWKIGVNRGADFEIGDYGNSVDDTYTPYLSMEWQTGKVSITDDLVVGGGDITLVNGGTIGIDGAKWTFDDTNDDITTTGNVGIGTIDPQAKLDIWGGDIYLNDASEGDDKFAATVGYVKEAVEGSAGVGIWRDAGSYIYPNTSSSFVIEDGGDVGIGITNPTEKLHISGGSVLIDNTGDLKISYDPESDNSHYNFDLIGANQRGFIFTPSKAGDRYITLVGSASTSNQYFVAQDDDGDSSTRFGHYSGNGYILSTGNVGIGTRVPGADLDVNSSNNIGIILRHTSRPTMQFTDGSNHAYIGLDSGNQILTGAEDNDLVFRSPDKIRFGANSTLDVTIDSTGNVAIGTTSAGFKLDVLTPDFLTDDSAFIRIQRADADAQRVGITLYDPNSSAIWSMYADQGSTDLLFDAAGTVAATITDDGYVGIGPDYLTPTGLLDVNNKFIVTDTQVTMNVPLNLAAAGDISIASDLQFTSPTASYIKSYAPLYLQAGNSNYSYDLTLRAFNSGEVVSDAQMNLANNKIVSLGTPTDNTDAATKGYVDSSMVTGDADWAGVGEDPISLEGEIYHTGNVGIGTDDPGIYKLNIWGDLRSDEGNLYTESGVLTAKSFSDIDDTSKYLDPGRTDGYGLVIADSIQVNGVNPDRDNYFAGNVGIGIVDTGSYKLYVNGGNAYFSHDIIVNGGDITLSPISDGTSAQIADTFAANTYKSYISLTAGTGSSDPGYIMHETSGSETNEGVLHLAPSDDNSYGDYVSIHGTNDVDMIKLHTSGDIEGVNTIGISIGAERIDFDSSNNQIEIMGGNVGISSANPATTLDVGGTIQSLGFVMPTGASADKVLTAEDATGTAYWKNISEISGVTGPGSSTDNAIVRFNGTTGKIIQNSGVTIDDSDNMNISGYIYDSGSTLYLNDNVDIKDTPQAIKILGTEEQWELIRLDGGSTSYYYGMGRAGSSRTWSGREAMDFHVNTDKSFLWASTGWDKLMELTGGTGDLRIKGDLTVSGGDITLVNNGTTGIGGAKWTFDDTNDDISTSGNVGIGTADPQQELHVQGNIIGSVYYDLVDSNYYLDSGANIYSYGLYSKGSVYSEGSANNYFAGNVGIGTTVPDTILTIANDEWISAKDSAGTGHVNMFKVNTSNEIEVGGTLNIGTIGLAEDSGVVTLVNMPVSSTPIAGTEESYSFAIDSEAILKVYSEADGTGGVQNKRVGIGTISPDYQLTVTEDFGFDDGSMYIEDISGTTTVSGNYFYGLGGSNYLKLDDSATSLNVAGVINVLGTADDNYFAGDVGIGTTTPTAKLDIKTAYANSKWILVINQSNSGALAPAAHDSVLIQREDVAALKIYDNGDGGALGLGAGDGDGVIASSNELEFYTGGSADSNIYSGMGGSLAMNIDVNQRIGMGYSSVGSSAKLAINGNVGVGTTSPQMKLEIETTAGTDSKLGIAATGTGIAALYLDASNGDFSGSDYGYLKQEDDLDIVLGTGSSQNGNLILWPDGGAGNVGINTTTPTANKLVVSGGGITFEGGGSHYITGMTPLGSGDPDTYAADKGYVDAAVEGTGGIGIWQDAGSYIYPDTSSSFVIEDGGDVGIGTTNPGKKLHVYGGDIQVEHSTPHIRLKDTDSGGSRPLITFENNSELNFAGDDAENELFLFRSSFSSSRSNDAILRVYGSAASSWNTYLQLTHDGTDGIISTDVGDIVLQPNGNVGIGITIPAAKLDVNGNILVSNAGTPKITLNNSTGEIYSNEVGDGSFLLNPDSRSASAPSYAFTNDENTGMYNPVADELGFAINGAEEMRIDSNGDVGIGTTVAGFKLDVLTHYLPLEDDSFIRIQRDDADDQQVGLTLYDPGSTSLWSMYVPNSSSNLYFEQNSIVYATITDDGYFGIGTDYLAPQGLLDVNNKFIVTDQQVTMNVPLNLAAAGDISIASDLQFTSPTASYIKSYAPLYIEAGDPSQNVDLTLRGSNSGEVIVDDNFLVTGNAVISGGLTIGSATLNGDIDLQDTYNITGVNKLTVSTIDPIHEINGKEYATFVSFYAGGQKMETSGVIRLQARNQNSYQYIIDFNNLEVGSDLWLFWETIHQDLDKLTVILSPGFDGRVWYEKQSTINNPASPAGRQQSLIIYSDQPGEVSYTLVAPRYDYKKWPNLISSAD